MKRIALNILLLFAFATAFSQSAPPSDRIAIEQNFQNLNVLGSVLYVAAHPDDENTRLLAYLAQERYYRTAYLAITRGDGGQNLIGNEQSELLGLIRTQELLAARRVDGAEQFFTRANDFGFSKGPDETLKIWDREKVLGDVVWAIRKFRPDVIICRFNVDGSGGHGHHTSSGILAREAFSLAADPTKYPEQLKYVQVWQAKRILLNGGGPGGGGNGQLRINVGVYNPLIGKGYGEVAADSRSNHKTQGFGSAKQRGESFESFNNIFGDAPVNDLMDGVNTTWTRVKEGAAIAEKLATIRKNHNSEDPSKSVPALVQLLSDVEKVSDVYWREQKGKQLKDLIAACAGLWFESYATQATYGIGDPIEVRSQVINRFNDQVKLNSIDDHHAVQRFDGGKVIPANAVQTFNTTSVADKYTQPYWLESPHPIGTYTVNDPLKIGSPENPDLAVITYEFTIAGKPITFDRRLYYKYVDQVRGEVYQPLEIGPPVAADIVSKGYIFSNQQAQTVQVKLEAFTKADGSISIKPVAGWKITPEKIDFTGKNRGDEWVATFQLSPTNAQPRTSVLEAVVAVGGKNYSMGVERIRYEHVPAITLFPPSQAKAVYIDLRVAGKKIGYIAGAGDFVSEALTQVGYEVHQLTENDIVNGDLSVYDAIITGVRAYNVNTRLAVEQSKLMAYVNNGGNMVVQYNNNNRLAVPQVGPYPFRVLNQRVTDEFAAVTFLDPQNPVLNYPNKITQADFDGWIQERGLYFVGNIDPQYKTPLQMNDPGEAPNNGSLIVGDYGKGRFIYTSLAFFRELPAGVPGAYRLFVNLLSKPK